MFEEPIRLAASGLSPISVAPPRSIATWLFRRRDQNRLRDRIEAEEAMYHPSRGGVRGGRDQFKWDDVKVDKHRENYLGHSVNAPVGRWQKGKDLFWYTRDKQSASSEMDSIREEIKRIKEDEEQAMREALGLAPKRASRPQGNRLDQHEYTELVKRGSTADDLGAQHAEAIMVQGLGLYKAPRNQPDSSTLQRTWVVAPGKNEQTAISESAEDLSTDKSRKRRRREETDERRHDGSRDEHRKHHEKKRSHDSDDKQIHQSRHKGKRRHDSD